MVRGRNSLYFGSKWRSCTVRARCFESFEFALNECFVDGHLDNDRRHFAHGCLKFLEIS